MATATTSNSAADPVALVTGIRGYDPVATAGDFQFEPSETQPAILMGEQGIALAGVTSLPRHGGSVSHRTAHNACAGSAA